MLDAKLFLISQFAVIDANEELKFSLLNEHTLQYWTPLRGYGDRNRNSGAVIKKKYIIARYIENAQVR